jgi:hypothetical protein
MYAHGHLFDGEVTHEMPVWKWRLVGPTHVSNFWELDFKVGPSFMENNFKFSMACGLCIVHDNTCNLINKKCHCKKYHVDITHHMTLNTILSVVASSLRTQLKRDGRLALVVCISYSISTGTTTHEIEGPWPLHSKIYHWSKRPRPFQVHSIIEGGGLRTPKNCHGWKFYMNSYMPNKQSLLCVMLKFA